MKTLLILIIVALLASCASTPGNPFVAPHGAPAWPPSPETARVRHVTSFDRADDLFRSGNFLTSFVRFTFGEDDITMVRPYAVAMHPNGGVIVTDPGIARVHYFDIERRRHHLLGEKLEDGLPSPVGVAVTEDGSILVSDSRRLTIERFNASGEHIGQFGGEHRFLRPGGIGVSPQTGEVFVADILGHAVVAFSPRGDLLRVMGGNGAMPGMFNFPTHLAFTSDGNLLVADSMNFRIQTLAPTGEALAVYGDPGNARGDFARPKGVASINDDVHAAIEGLYNSLVFFNAQGELLLVIGEQGSGAGEFWLPAGLAMDRSRNLLFVADSYNSRVQVFEMLSEQAGLTAIPAGGGTAR